MSALTVGVTTARYPECKRGLAVNLAASLAREHPETRVCLVDADPLERDVTTRLAVRGPAIEDFAPGAGPALGSLSVVEGLSVLPCAGGGLARVRLGAEHALPALREAFDVVVVDLVGGPTGPGRAIGGRLDALDWLLLAVTPDPDAVAASAHFLEMIETARARGAIDVRLRIGIVVTGDEGSTVWDAVDVDRALGASAPVVGRVRQLWGRSAPNLGFGAALRIPELDDAVRALVGELAGGHRERSRSAV